MKYVLEIKEGLRDADLILSDTFEITSDGDRIRFLAAVRDFIRSQKTLY